MGRGIVGFHIFICGECGMVTVGLCVWLNSYGGIFCVDQVLYGNA